MKVDYLIVGSGLTGATIARMLFDTGFKVAVVDSRSHLGGNVHDYQHPSGIRIHTYGPHYFRTSCDEVWSFVNRFASFYPFEAVVKSLIDGRYENWPVAASCIKRHACENWTAGFHGEPTNFEEAALSLMPRVVYEKFVKEYNEKQWGAPAHTLLAELCSRFDIRPDDEPRLTPDAGYQGLPIDGYTEMMRQMLVGIPLILNCNYLEHRREVTYARKLVFTGPIDAFFRCDLGRLSYRAQQREHRYLPGVSFAQPTATVNNPMHNAGGHIRTIEWKRMMEPVHAARIDGTVLTTETPFSPEDPSQYEYPFPDRENAALYKRYRDRADKLEDTVICGRLGEYRYYDMDMAIDRAMTLARSLIAEAV